MKMIENTFNYWQLISVTINMYSSNPFLFGDKRRHAIPARSINTSTCNSDHTHAGQEFREKI